MSLYNYTGIFFTGGDQVQIIHSLFKYLGESRWGSLALKILLERYMNKELALMGSSAGSACM